MKDLEGNILSTVSQLYALTSSLEESAVVLEEVESEMRRGSVRGVSTWPAVECLEEEMERRRLLVAGVRELQRDGLNNIYCAIYEAVDEIAQRTAPLLPTGGRWESGEDLEDTEERDEKSEEELLRKSAYVELFGGLTDGHNKPFRGGHYLRFPDLPKTDRSAADTEEIFRHFMAAREVEQGKLKVLDQIMERMEASAEAGFPLEKGIQAIACQRIVLAQRAKTTDSELETRVGKIIGSLRKRVDKWSTEVLEKGIYQSISDLLDA
jgi:hypothetical protein